MGDGACEKLSRLSHHFRKGRMGMNGQPDVLGNRSHLYGQRAFRDHPFCIWTANAEGMISEGTLAIEMGAVAQDIGLTIHPHPTLSEMVGETAELFTGTVTHVLPGEAFRFGLRNIVFSIT